MVLVSCPQMQRASYTREYAEFVRNTNSKLSAAPVSEWMFGESILATAASIGTWMYRLYI